MTLFLDNRCSHCYPIDGKLCRMWANRCIDSLSIGCSTTPGKSQGDEYDRCKPTKGTLPFTLLFKSWLIILCIQKLKIEIILLLLFSLAVETCVDRIKNQGEDKVDCGGPCLPCRK